MRILHIAPYNTAGIPIAFVQAERKLGYESHLVTLNQSQQRYPEDICLNLSFWKPEIVAKLKKICYPKPRPFQDSGLAQPLQIPPVWKPANRLAGLLINLRDRMTRPLIEGYIKKYHLDSFDVYQLDGGQGFSKKDNIIPKWHAAGKKVICCYLGSDLRVRGVMPEIDAISDLNITLEWDHLDLHPHIAHCYAPFDISQFTVAAKPAREKLRIGHSPTSRSLKGTERIIRAIEHTAQRHPVEMVLIENLSHAEALKAKADCDIGIDQISPWGYGISTLEWLAMGIPVATSIAPRMASEVKNHPLVDIDEDTIEERLERLVSDHSYRNGLAARSRKWLEETHEAGAVVAGILDRATSEKI
jgi:hypothetical protein